MRVIAFSWTTLTVRSAGMALALLCVSLSAIPANAQQSSLFGGGSSSTSAGRGTGGTSGGSATGAGGGIGANNLAQTGTLNLGGTGTIQPGQARQGGFVGRSDNSGRFVGQSMAGQQTGGATSAGRGGSTRRTGSNGGFGGNNGGFGGGFGGQFGNQFGNQFGGAGTTAARVIRPQQRVAFEYNVPETAVVQETITTRFQSLPTPLMRGLTIAPEADGVFVLRGEVKSVAESKLAAAMLRQEPGVKTVRNELSITPVNP